MANGVESEQSDLGQHCLLGPVCPNIKDLLQSQYFRERLCSMVLYMELYGKCSKNLYKKKSISKRKIPKIL